MSDSFSAVKVTDRVYWVGAIDWELRDFHGYSVQRGSTYNAYLVLAEKIALIDTVKAPFFDQMLARIASVVDPAKVAYVIANHAEMDHSGALPQVIERLKPEKVIASNAGVKALADHFHLGQGITGVKDGETLSLGNAALSFVAAPMLHWPESMLTYLAEDRLLFSNDAFGMHLASSKRFADEIPEWILDYEASRYFANILLPYSALVTKLLDKVAKLGIAIDIIAPSHGPIWRPFRTPRVPSAPLRAGLQGPRGADPGWIASRYATWAAGPPTEKAVIVYDTMWHSTELMAHAIAEGVAAGGATASVMPLRGSHRSDVAQEMLGAGALLVGSPTLNNGMLPAVADVLTYLKGLKPRVGLGAAFGSYGWSGEAQAQMEEVLRAMNVELIREPLKVRYVPDQAALAECFALGQQVADRLKSQTAPAGS